MLGAHPLFPEPGTIDLTGDDYNDSASDNDGTFPVVSDTRPDEMTIVQVIFLRQFIFPSVSFRPKYGREGRDDSLIDLPAEICCVLLLWDMRLQLFLSEVKPPLTSSLFIVA